MTDDHTTGGTREETNIEKASEYLATLMESGEVDSFIFAGVNDSDPDHVAMEQLAVTRDGCDIPREMLLAAMMCDEAKARGMTPTMYLYRLAGVAYLLDEAVETGQGIDVDLAGAFFGGP